MQTYFRPPFVDLLNAGWVNNWLDKLSPEQRIAQLLHVAAYSNRDEEHLSQVSKLIAQYQIGGLIFFQGDPLSQAEQTNRYQQLAQVPLLISMDAEWGLGMRLKDAVSFPYAMTLGALSNDNLIYDMASELAKHLKSIGVHVNFAPVADINSNPKNPVISFRSFGEQKNKVSAKALAYMKGLQDQGILAVAKHFPGHGDTDTDSHFGLPILQHKRKRLEEIEWYPFCRLFEKGLGGIMTGHLYLPAIEPIANLPSTLSKEVVTDLLQRELQFEGLIFTDALDMKGVSQYLPAGEINAKALLAGNDVMLFCVNVPASIAEIEKMRNEGMITQEQIDYHCRKLLAAKLWLGLDSYQPIKIDTVMGNIHTPEAERLNRTLAENTITLLRNQAKILPLDDLDNKRLATIAVAGGQSEEWKSILEKNSHLRHHFEHEQSIENLHKHHLTVFQRKIDQYLEADHFFITPDMSLQAIVRTLKEVEEYDYILVSVHNLAIKPIQHFGITESLRLVIEKLAEEPRCIICFFGNAYALAEFETIHLANTLILTYQENFYAEETAARLILGEIDPMGRLPVTVNAHFKQGDGMIENVLL